MEPAPELEVSPISFASYAHLLGGNRNFRRLWSAQVVSEIGDWFYTLAIYSLLLQLTGRAGSVALALVLQVLPQTFVGPLSGVVNDRIRRKHVMIAALLGRDAVFVLNALSFLASAWLIRGMGFEEPHADSSRPLRVRDLVDYSPVIEGIRYVRCDVR